MAYVCPVCEQSAGVFKCSQLKDGVVCNSCFEKSGLKQAGFPPKLVEVWEVVTLCDMSEDEKLKHIEKKREQLRQENEAAKARMETMAVHQPEPAVPTCPKCGSTSLSGNKRGYSLMTGFIGANKVKITCMNCGHQWMAGKK